MSKRQQPKKTVNQLSVTSALSPIPSLSAAGKLIRFLSNKKIQLLFIVAITFAFYGNSISNDFASDDAQYYYANQFVQKGVGGIYNLFTKESMYGYYGNTTPVRGGRWRPLSLITFALEKEYFNANPHVSHFINVLLLALTGVIMLLFLRQYIFISLPIAAFMVTLLFIIHPIHTEAVSHIKSRDELLSWLFLLLTLYCSLNFLTTQSYWQLLLSLIFYFFALLSKENGVTFIVILPLTFYFFTKEKLRAILLATVPFAGVFGSYMLLRISFVPVVASAGADITIAPYLYATPVQHIATALMVLGKYILLLFLPNPLISDYSYNSIPYVNFYDCQVWLSLLMQAALVVYALLKLKEKNLVSYGILFYFCSIFIVSNIVVDVGAIMGERFLYQPSFGFCIAIVAVVGDVLQKIKFKTATQKFSTISVLIIAVVLLSGFQTIQRNAEWSTVRTLLTSDVKKAPNCLALHENLGGMFMTDGSHAPTPQQRGDDLNSAISEFDTAITILPGYAMTWHNLGNVYAMTGNNDNAEKAFLNCINADSTYAMGYNGLGVVYYNEKKYGQALACLKRSIQLDSNYALSYFNIGLCYHFMGDYEKEINYYNKVLSLNLTTSQEVNPVNLQLVKQNLATAESLLQNKK